MSGAFGTTFQPKWLNHQLLENHPRICSGGLRGSEVIISIGNHQQVVKIESQWCFGEGKKQRRRPRLICPVCQQRCIYLVVLERDGSWLRCRTCCTGILDYASRHHARFAPALNKLRRLRRLYPNRRPSHRLAREAQLELAQLARATIRDLDRRAKRRRKRR